MTRRKRVLVALLGLLAFGLGFLSALRSAPAEQRFDLKVRQDFFAGFSGNEEALNRGMEACEASLAADPKNAEAMVWHGSGLYYRGGRAFQGGDSQKGMELVQRGLSEMSRAVELDPSNVGVRIPRGAILLQSTLYMPETEFSRKLVNLGLQDYLATYDLQKDYFETLSTHARGELLSGIANAHSRAGNRKDAEKFYHRMAEDLPGSVYQKRAEKWLSGKPLEPVEVMCVGCHVPGR